MSVTIRMSVGAGAGRHSKGQDMNAANLVELEMVQTTPEPDVLALARTENRKDFFADAAGHVHGVCVVDTDILLMIVGDCNAATYAHVGLRLFIRPVSADSAGRAL